MVWQWKAEQSAYLGNQTGSGLLENVMSAGSYFEIVQLANGDFALQPAGGGGEHLVKISFGPDAKAFLAEKDVDVAHAMISAAIKAVGVMREEAQIKSAKEEEPKTVH